MSKTHMIDEHKSNSSYNSAWTMCGLGGIPRWMVTKSEEYATCKNCLRAIENREKRHEQSAPN